MADGGLVVTMQSGDKSVRLGEFNRHYPQSGDA